VATAVFIAISLDLRFWLHARFIYSHFISFRWDTLRLLSAIEIHRNRAVYVSLNTNANPTPNPNTNPNPNPKPKPNANPNPNPNLK